MSGYAPKSPDLSSINNFAAAHGGPTLNDQQQHHQPQHHHPPQQGNTYPPLQPSHLVLETSPSYTSSHSASGQRTPYLPPLTPQSSRPSYPYGSSPQSYVPPRRSSSASSGNFTTQLGEASPRTPQNPYHRSSHPQQPPYGPPPPIGYPPYSHQYQPHPLVQQPLEDPNMPTRRQAAMMAAAASRGAIKQEAVPIAPDMPSERSMSEGEREAEADREFKPDPDDAMSGGPSAMPQVSGSLEPIEPGVVRTKFPTARIKRIMQADEEVGKVAQQTPIAVGKALELFMSQLVTKSAEIARAEGTKRVTAPMLKHVVENDPQWDFLQEIVGKVPNQEKEGKGRARAETESEGESGEPKKKGRGRKKKATPE